MSGVFERQTRATTSERVMKIMCTYSEAAMLLDVANYVDPDSARYRAAHRSRKPAVDFYPLGDSLFLSGSSCEPATMG
jgi:hypothetical protein